MFIDYCDKINPSLEKLDFAKAIEIAEAHLQEQPDSDFHAVIGITLVDQAGDVADWIDQFYQSVSKKIKVEALYFEMNEFTINPDLWFINGLAYDKDGGLHEDYKDMDWLCDWNFDTEKEIDSVFVIKNLEKLQTAFERYTKDVGRDIPWTKEVEAAQDWCAHIIVVRFMELMRNAHLVAKQKQYAWSKIPIYFTFHEYTFIVKSEN